MLPAYLFLSACENSIEDINRVTSRGTGVEIAKEVQITYSIGERAHSVITAPLMYRHQEAVPYIEFPRTLHVDFYDDSLRIESRLDAHYAKYLESDSKFYLKDSVVLMNTSGDTLYCQELYWDCNRVGNEFYTDKPVRIRTPTHIINGDGFDSPQDFSNKHIVNARGIVRVSSSEFPE